ncbi:MAG: hypothetical protein IKU86_11040 [Thermoguttaceae bacterium]|nr:hypothetical protein [Thermoguttaceae bacterium]
MSSKFNVGRFAPFVAAFGAFFLYWAALPPSWSGWAVFFVPAVWAATVFNPEFAAWRRRSSGGAFPFGRQNGESRENDKSRQGGEKRRFRRTRRFARFIGRVFFGGEYRQYWTAAFCFWAATVVWISYPHPATTLGWLAASAYLAIYFPLFVAATRALTGVRPERNCSDVAQNGETARNAATLTTESVATARIAETAQNKENAGNKKTPPTLTLRVRQTTRKAQNWQTAQGEQVGETARNRRTAKRFGFPLWLAAPIAWTAVEWARNRGLGGFSFAGLSHSLYDFPQFIQIAEPFGEYGVGAAIVAIGTLLGTAVAAAVSRNCAKTESAESRGESASGANWGSVALSLCGAGAIFGAVVGFGVRRLEFFDAAERAALEAGAVPCRVALLQDGTTYRFPVPDYQNRKVAETYLALAAEAARFETPFDVVVWPESCFDVFWDEKTTAESASAATAEVERIARAEKSRALARSRRDAAKLTERLGASAILGTTALLVDVDAEDETTVFNAAVFAPRFDSTTVAALGEKYVGFNATVPAPISANEAEETRKAGELEKEEGWAKYVDWQTPASTAPNDPNPLAFRLYGKRRLVVCGEYIPGADLLPDWFPLKAVCADFSLERGVGPVVFPVARRGGAAKTGENEQNEQAGPLLFAPHICFESSIPHYVKEQVRELTAVGAEPDVLVCLSNDGWFRNGSQTDGHLATQVFRAVENRKPVVAATHGGFSAHVDQAGRVRSRGARRGTEVVAAEVWPVDCERLGRTALLGGRDLAETLALGCVLLGLGAFVARKVGGRRSRAES